MSSSCEANLERVIRAPAGRTKSVILDFLEYSLLFMGNRIMELNISALELNRYAICSSVTAVLV